MMVFDNVWVNRDDSNKLREMLDSRNKGKAHDEQITAQDLAEDILSKGIQREHNIFEERKAQDKNKIKIMREYAEITNEILNKSNINFTVFVTKDGHIRIKGHDENVVLRDDGRILSDRRAISWVDDVLTLNDDGCYPKTTEEETKQYQKLSQELILWKYKHYTK